MKRHYPSTFVFKDGDVALSNVNIKLQPAAEVLYLPVIVCFKAKQKRIQSKCPTKLVC